MRRGVMRADRDTGLTLIELIAAILVLSLGSLAALRASDQAGVAIQGGTERALAQIVVRNRAEALRIMGAAGAGLPAQVVQGGQAFDLSTARTPTAGGLIEAQITARGPGGAGAQLVIYLPGAPF